MNNWLIIFDNADSNSKYPRGWVLTEAFYFSEIFPKDFNVIFCIIWKNEWYYARIKNKNVIEEININNKLMDGIIFSLTSKTVNNFLIKSDFLSKIILTVKSDSPIILCTGLLSFNDLKMNPAFKNRKIIFVKKIAIKWFNYHLSMKVQSFF